MWFRFVIKHDALQKAALTVATLTAFMGSFLISSVNIALPAIEKEFSLNAVSLSWIVNSYLLSSAVFLLPVGRFADLRGQKKVFQWGIAAFTVSSALCGIAPSGTLLSVFRALQGISSAMTITTGMPIMISVFSPPERGKVLGINVASVYLGLSAGPLFGGILTQHWGWRSIFLLCIPFGLAVAVLTFVKLQKFTDNTRTEGFDYAGTILYMLSFAGLVYGSVSLGTWKGPFFLASGALLFFLFVRQAFRTADPVFDMRLFTRNRAFAFSNIAALINYSATFAIVFLMSIYLQKVKGLPPHEAGTVLVAQPIVMALLSPLAGRLSDRVEPRLPASLGMFINAAGLFLLSTVKENTSITAIVAMLILMGLGFALFSSPNMNTIMSSVGRNQYGTASATSATMRATGQMTSMAVATMIFVLFFGNEQIMKVPEPLFMKSLHTGFLVFAIICLTGVWFSYGRGRIRKS